MVAFGVHLDSTRIRVASDQNLVHNVVVNLGLAAYKHVQLGGRSQHVQTPVQP